MMRSHCFYIPSKHRQSENTRKHWCPWSSTFHFPLNTERAESPRSKPKEDGILPSKSKKLQEGLLCKQWQRKWRYGGILGKAQENSKPTLQEQGKTSIQHRVLPGEKWSRRISPVCALTEGTHFLTSIRPSHLKGCAKRTETLSKANGFWLPPYLMGMTWVQIAESIKGGQKAAFLHPQSLQSTLWHTRDAGRKKRQIHRGFMLLRVFLFNSVRLPPNPFHTGII